MEHSSPFTLQDVWEKLQNLPLTRKGIHRQTSTSCLYNDLMYANDLASVNEGTINHCNDALV